jgi:gas vesicle protein
MRKLLSFLAGAIVGAMVGAAVVVMLAPESGDNTRSEIRGYVNSVVDEGRRAATERRAELEAQFAQSKQFSPRA